MALTPTILRFKVSISDVERAVYQNVEFRVAQHSSESEAFLLTRVIAYLLNWQEGIEFSAGIATPDEAAIYVKDLTGKIVLWIDIGNPSARRLHKASKAAPQVKIYTHKDPAVLLESLQGEQLYKPERIEIYSLRGKFLEALEGVLAKDNQWDFLHDEGELTVTANGQTIHSDLSRVSLS